MTMKKPRITSYIHSTTIIGEHASKGQVSKIREIAYTYKNMTISINNHLCILQMIMARITSH
jgi:hypothetical protein